MDKWLVDGAPATDVPLDDRGLHYGDGLFETIAVRAASCRFLDAHLARLEAGCARLGIPLTTNRVRADVATLLGSAPPDGTLKIMVTRGSGPRGYAPPTEPQSRLIIGFAAGLPQVHRAGMRVIVCRTPVARNPALAGLKTLNRLEQVLARAEVAESGADEGLMLNDQGAVVCGTMSNLFLLDDQTLVTPALTEAGICGVMRAQVLAVAGDLAIDVVETTVTEQQLRDADGLFLTNSLMGISPVADLDGRAYPVGETVRQIAAELARRGVRECAP